MTDQEIRDALQLIRRTAAEIATEIHNRAYDYGGRPAIAVRVAAIQAQAGEALGCRIPQVRGELTVEECRSAIEDARMVWARESSSEAWTILEKTKAMARARYPEHFQ